MLRLLKSGVCSNLGEAARTLGYSRLCQRWFITYRQEGSEELLVSRVGERGRMELVTEEAMKEGEIASIAQAFLARRGISRTDPSSVGQLLKWRRGVRGRVGA